MILKISTSLAKTFDLLGGSDDLSFPMQLWIVLSSRTNFPTSPSFQRTRRLDSTSWWCLASDFRAWLLKCDREEYKGGFQWRAGCQGCYSTHWYAV